ncbi:MAG: DUF5309 family protein [Patescibacteria group bacterium]
MAGIYEADQVAKLAELGDTIFIAESEKTPFSRLLKRGNKPVQMLSEWPVQKYPDRAFAGQLDGTDLASFEHTNRVKISGYAMWMMTAGWMASRLANLTRTAGVKGSERAKQAADDALILAQMIEKQLLSDDDTQAESGSDPYTSRAVYSWLNPSAQATLPVNADFRPSSNCTYTGALASFQPGNMETILQACATAKKGAVDLTEYAGIELKVQMSGWAQRHVEDVNTAQALQKYNINISEKKLMRVVDTFEFDAGVVTVFPSWYMACTRGTGAISAYTPKSGVLLDMDMWELCFLDQPSSWVLPPQSGGPRGYHDAVYILRCHNPLGQGYVLTNT